MSLEARDAHFFGKAKQLGVELEKPPAERVVVTGYAVLTPLGNTEETLEGLYKGKSGVIAFNKANHFEVGIAAPVKFDPQQYFTEKQMREKSTLHAMTNVVVREAMGKAGLLGGDGKLRKDINRRTVAPWIGSGFGSSHLSVDTFLKIHGEKDQYGNEDMAKGAHRVNSKEALKIFPEGNNGGVAEDLQISGWPGNLSEACATGLSNIVGAAHLIKSGEAKIAIAGGFEDVLTEHPEIAIDLFGAMNALSKRKNDPEMASRPFDKDRDGFVIGAGGGAVIVESLKSALERRATIFGEILTYSKSIDGDDPVKMNKEIVAGTILDALYDKKTKKFIDIDAYLAHATSTPHGDLLEAEMFMELFGKYYGNVLIAAIKSNLGHLLGGAGAVNFIVGLNGVYAGKIPNILNLENPDPRLAGLNFARGQALQRVIKKVLVGAFGFRGHNSAAVIAKYEG